MNQGPKILVIGGGSVSWTPNIVRDILHTKTIARPTLVLYDINKAAAQLTAAFIRKLIDELGLKAKVIATDRKRYAFDRADYAIITISTGGFDAMDHDLAIPQHYGIYQTVGDSTGPGGWARFIRNYPVFIDLANHFSRYAPNCVVLNYTNPMCTLTDVLARRHTGPVIGLCHGLFENIAFFQQLYNIKNESDLSLRYAGLNHFFWITRAQANGKDLLADLKRKLRRKSFTELARGLHADPMGFSSGREVATELFQTTGVMPYMGDRHTSEFLPCYLTDRDTLIKYKLVRTTIAKRRQQFRTSRKRLQRMIAGTIPSEYHHRTRETAADIIDAHLNGRSFIDVGNVPNTGQIAGLPHGVVVETAVRIDSNGFEPMTFGKLPSLVEGLVMPHTLAYQMQVQACMNNDLKLALQALRLDPQCNRLTGQRIEEMGRKLLKSHQKYLHGLFN